MKSRRTIWSLPLVLVTALLLVGLFSAAVLAQTNTAPAVGVQISDVEITIGAQVSNPSPQPSLADADGPDEDGDGDGSDTADPAFTGPTGVDLVYTAVTSDERVADVTLTGETDTLTNGWWDRLGSVDANGAPSQIEEDTDCSKRAAKLGFTAGAGIRGNVPADANPHRAGLAATTDPVAAAVPATGLCDDSDNLSTIDDNPRTEAEETDWDAEVAVNNVFHWDMLTGPEMVAVAQAANESVPSAYEEAFGDLTGAEQNTVAGWFEDGFLAKGTGGLAVSNDGIDDTAPHGKVGTATIYVKVSDQAGRFLGSSIGQSFTVTTVLDDAPLIPDFGDPTTDANTRISADEDTGNEVDFVPANTEAGTDARFEVRVSPGAEFIGDIVLGGSYELDPNEQAVTFSLTNGGDVAFQVNQAQRAVTAKIETKPGVTLTAGNPYHFTVVVNEIGRAPQNSAQIDVRVMVVLDNVRPSFNNQPVSGTIAERAKNETIATFTATDQNNQVINYSIPSATIDALGIEIGTTTGVLKTKNIEEAGIDLPDFVEDDLETEDEDESTNEDGSSKNVHEIVITASDGTLSDTHTFMLTISDVADPPPGSRQKLNMDEGVGTGEDGADESNVAPDLGGAGDYSIGQQIDNQGNITLDADDILFGIDRITGVIYLKEDKELDYESGLVTYTLSITRGTNSGIVVISVNDVNEAPEFSAVDNARTMPIALYVLESAAVGTVVSIGQDAGNSPTSIPAMFTASDEDSAATGNSIAYDLWFDDPDDSPDAGLELYAGADAMFRVGANGAIEVNSMLDTDADDAVRSIDLVLRAVDAGEQGTPPDLTSDLKNTITIMVSVIDTNVGPVFDDPSRAQTHATVSEGAAVGTMVYTYRATDEDGDEIEYRLRDEDDAPFFTVEETTNAAGEAIGILRTNAGLDYESQTQHTVEIQAADTDDDTDEIVITIDVTNANDNAPAFGTIPANPIRIAENSPRGTPLGSFAATDADGDDVTYSLSGADAKSFHIDGYGELKTLESLDYDSNTPCSVGGCAITVVASDANAASGAPTSAHTGPAEAARTIMVLPIEDSVSTLSVTKANPVPGTTMGDANTALGNTKESMSDDVPERPTDLPNKDGAPLNFVETDWGNWGTVLRIEVTAQSPDANCGSGNECVVISLNSDSADDTLKLQAYRLDTPAGAASNENKFVAAVMLVELDGEATDIKTSSGDDIPVYAHGDGSVARLQVDEEDEIEIEFYNLRGDVEVENEAPEISNFAPVHESAFDDPDVDYTFTVTDSHSGLPEPEDLPDADGDDAYMPAVALISKGQCETADSDASSESKKRRAELISDGFSIVEDMAGISDDGMLYCPGIAQDGEYDASGAGYGFAPIRDDKDFDDIDDGFDVETTIVLRENRIFYVTFVACDNAGNCSFFDPDGNDDGEELAEITVDTEDPVFVEARTGLTWDSTDNEYDDNRSFIQVIFNDLTKLNTETVEIDDFVVEGHTIKDVQVYENPDSDDVDWGDSGRYGAAGHPNKRGIARYRDIENVVFIELEDELLADETPDVTIVPNGVEDKAGNEQDDGDHEADDWISPKFTIVSIVSTRVTSQDQILAGDDDEVTVVVTSDERLDSTRPTVTVTYVIAPPGSINTKGTEDCDDGTTDGGTRERGEIINSDECADSSAATGGNLNNSVEKVSNTEWIVTITEPKDTGYYNFRISGNDRSPQENPGSEGVSPGSIVTDFFDADGDVNVDDAIFFEGDINLPKPQVRVSGVRVENNEADVEFRSPLFVELDFAANHSDNCTNVDNDERMANCMNENSEYAEDNFDDIVVTSFMLDGVDLTDSVKTTDNQSFLVSLESISIGDHTAEVQAVDQAGNVFEDTLEIDFEVNDRDPFEKRLSPGWNLVSLPGEPADSSIASVFGPGVEVRTVYSYDPVIPGGWMVAVRETLDSDWQGDLTEINGRHGYWVLSDAIQDWEVSIPRLAGGAAGTGTPIQPPVIPLYAGWNLIPVTDISGNGSGGDTLNAVVYLQSLEAGVEAARVLGFDTIRNQWETVLDPDMQMNNTLEIGAGYWIFVREATSLVPSGYVSGGGSDWQRLEVDRGFPGQQWPGRS